MSPFFDMIVTMDDLIQNEGDFIYLWTLTGTNMSSGGRGVCISGMRNGRSDEDGLILESLGHFDEAEYQRELNAGVSDAPPIASM